MKLPSLEGAVITMKSDQKEVKRCYENNLKTKKGVCAITTRFPMLSPHYGISGLTCAPEKEKVQ